MLFLEYKQKHSKVWSNDQLFWLLSPTPQVIVYTQSSHEKTNVNFSEIMSFCYLIIAEYQNT